MAIHRFQPMGYVTMGSCQRTTGYEGRKSLTNLSDARCDVERTSFSKEVTDGEYGGRCILSGAKTEKATMEVLFKFGVGCSRSRVRADEVKGVSVSVSDGGSLQMKMGDGRWGLRLMNSSMR
jgi:hypothetical protein